jgi:capsular exopolysaccharide synthesis family protein
MTLADHLRVIATNWWRILAIALAIGALAYGFSNSRDKVYQSGTLLSVAPGLGAPDQVQLDQDALSFRAEFYARIATQRQQARAGAAEARLDISDSEATSRLTTITNEAGFIFLQARGPSPEEATALANGVAEALRDFVAGEQADLAEAQVAVLEQRLERLETQRATAVAEGEEATVTRLDVSIGDTRQAIVDAQTRAQFQISVVTSAFPNRDPIAPRPSRDALLAFLLAGIISAEVFVIVRTYSDRFARAQDAASITELTGMPVLAMIPRGRGPDVVEAFRTLRTNLLFLEGAGRPRTVALVSPNPNSGKSFCAIHLAESAVAVDTEVVLVDADLRRPVIHSRVRVPREPGLSDALRGADIHHCVHCVEGIPNLKIMPSGSPVSDTVGVLGGRAFRQVLDTLDTAELVVVDTPPGAVYADALAVSAQCDATLLVLDAKTTRRRAARQLIDSLERTGATLIGVVVNNASYSRRDTYERG